jgi:hypothetical protein
MKKTLFSLMIHLHDLLQLQGFNSSGTNETVKSDDLYRIGLGAHATSLKQSVHEPPFPSFDSKLMWPLSEPVDNESLTYLTDRYISSGPWNPLATFGMPHTSTSIPTTYSGSWHTGSNLDTSSIYQTAKSDLFHSAASGIGGRGTDQMRTLSE